MFQNEDQLLNDASHILYNDPCREFTFGFTIEHRTMRLWYFSRSHISVTEGFDYHTVSTLLHSLRWFKI